MQAKIGRLEIVRELLKHDKADANDENKNGKTALAMAQRGHAETLRCLAELPRNFESEVSIEYINTDVPLERCIKGNQIANSPNVFVVKRIKHSEFDQAFRDESQESIQCYRIFSWYVLSCFLRRMVVIDIVSVFVCHA